MGCLYLCERLTLALLNLNFGSIGGDYKENKECGKEVDL